MPNRIKCGDKLSDRLHVNYCKRYTMPPKRDSNAWYTDSKTEIRMIFGSSLLLYIHNYGLALLRRNSI